MKVNIFLKEVSLPKFFSDKESSNTFSDNLLFSSKVIGITLFKISEITLVFIFILSIFILRFIIVWVVATSVLRHFFNEAFWQHLGVGVSYGRSINVAMALGYTILLRVVSPAMNFYKRIEDSFLDNLNKRHNSSKRQISETIIM